MSRRFAGVMAGLAVAGLAGAAEAVPVDLELSLVIDSSSSINTGEFSQQINGYAEAFRRSEVITSIVNSSNGIAVNSILFSSEANVVIPFTLLQTEADVLSFADELAAIARQSGNTNIGAGINLAVETLNTNDFESGNLIIDVSGDGEDNSGDDVTLSRDAALSAGVSQINGITIGDDSVFDFYQANVIGGTDAFVLSADSFDEFDAAIADKIGVELGVFSTPVTPPPSAPPPTAAPISVPAPGAIGLIGFGLVTIGIALRRRRR